MHFLVADKSISPKTANDVKLISGGKILENDKSVAQCRAPFGDLPSNAITMHVVVQPSSAKSKPGELQAFTCQGNCCIWILIYLIQFCRLVALL